MQFWPTSAQWDKATAFLARNLCLPVVQVDRIVYRYVLRLFSQLWIPIVLAERDCSNIAVLCKSPCRPISLSILFRIRLCFRNVSRLIPSSLRCDPHVTTWDESWDHLQPLESRKLGSVKAVTTEWRICYRCDNNIFCFEIRTEISFVFARVIDLDIYDFIGEDRLTI
jgi:hypothetical protein